MPDTLTHWMLSGSVFFVASSMTLYSCQSEPLFETPYTAYFASADGRKPASRVVPSSDHALGSIRTSGVPSSPFWMYSTLWFWSPLFLLKKKYGPLWDGDEYFG